MSEKRACGAHVELARTGGVKIARCPCGQVHVTLVRAGVTFQLSGGHLDELAHAASVAARAAAASAGAAVPLDIGDLADSGRKGPLN